MKQRIFFLTLYAALLSAGIFCFQQSVAQTSPAEGITISPPIFELDLKPGDVSRHKIQVTNPTENLIEFYPSARNFQAGGEGGQPTFDLDEEPSPLSLASWISFDQPIVAIAPRQVVEFQFVINVPTNAPPGGHYGSVFLSTKPPENSGAASQVALSSMVGSLLLIRIPGDITEKAVIDEFSTPWFYFKPPVPLTTFIRNTGNVHFRPEGEVTIRNWRGKDVQRITLNQIKGNVLPDSRRKFDLSWNPNISHFWQIPVGRFSATLRVVYGQQQQVIDQKIFFWIIPWWLIISTAIGLLVLIIVIWIIIRRRRKKKKQNKIAHSPRPPVFQGKELVDHPSVYAQPHYPRPQPPVAYPPHQQSTGHFNQQPPFPPRLVQPLRQQPHVFSPPVPPQPKPPQPVRRLTEHEMQIKKLLEKQIEK